MQQLSDKLHLEVVNRKCVLPNPKHQETSFLENAIKHMFCLFNPNSKFARMCDSSRTKFKESLDLIVNPINILSIFNLANDNDLRDYMPATEILNNENYIDICDFKLNGSLKDLIQTIDSYFYSFYKNDLAKLIFKEHVFKCYPQKDFHVSKIYNQTEFSVQLKDIEYQPYYCISYYTIITDIVESRTFTKENCYYDLTKSSLDNNIYAPVKLLVFPMIKTLAFLVLDSDAALGMKSLHPYSYDSIDQNISALVNTAIEEYFDKLVDSDTQINNMKSMINSSTLSKLLKDGIEATFTPKRFLQNLSGNPILSKTLQSQLIHITFGNVFNNLAYEYISDKKKYFIYFDINGEHIKNIKKPADIDNIKELKFMDEEDTSRIVTIYANRYRNMEDYNRSINTKTGELLNTYRITEKITKALFEKFERFMIKYQYHKRYYRKDAIPLLSYNFQFFNSGMRLLLRLYYSTDLDKINSNDAFVSDTLVTYTMYPRHRIKVNIFDEDDLDYNLFEEEMRRRVGGKYKRYSKEEFIYKFCRPFVYNFFNEFSDIEDIKDVLYKCEKKYVEKVSSDESLKRLLKTRKDHKALINLYKYGCELTNKINNSCNKITYTSSDSLERFIDEISYYTNWNCSYKNLM